MKKKNYRLLSLLLVIPMFLVACGNTGGGTPTPSEPKVTSVKITNPSETTVLDGTRVSLKATVTGDEGVSTKVTWTTSDSTVATVTNGVVSFLGVSQETKVTITAAAVADETFKDSVEFTVEHSPFDLAHSRGNPDTSLYLDEGSFTIEDPQDVALVYADVHHTRWYVEATIQIDTFDPDDAWPKFGIMASDRDDGTWCYEQSHQVFYYVDSVAAAQSWTNLNAVPETDDLTNWNWGGQLGSATASPAIKKGEPFKMGLMRDGNRFIQFYGKATDVTLGIVGTFEYNSFGENANYVWVGGWKTAVVVSDPVAIVGDEIDTLYTIPESISLKSAEEVLYLGDSYKIEVQADGLWDKTKLTFKSSDETVATVTPEGIVTASGEKTGTVTITVGFGDTELSAEFKLVVTDDKMYKVVIDGEMNDALWTEKVKANKYLLKKSDEYYVNIFAAKNSRGVYLFMDYVVKELAACNPNEWWTWENVEFRLANDGKAWGGQYWVSSMNGGSFVSVGSGEKAEEVCFKTLELGEDSLYHGAFEMFIPYGDDNVTKDNATYACFGFAPRAGWYNGYNWYAAIDDNCLNITADGFAHATAKCSDGDHAYGEWIVDVAPTCVAAGSRHRVCGICGHVETEILPINPEAHVFDYEHASIEVIPTCMNEGKGVAPCTLCPVNKETILPRDYTNHTDEEYKDGGLHNHCHDCGVGSHLRNASGDVFDHNFGGPWDKDNWYDIGLFEGDFSFTFEFHMQGCLGGNPSDWGSYCWRTALPFVYQEGYTGDKTGHFFRMDWCGFGEGSLFKSFNNGVAPADVHPNGYDLFNNVDVSLTYVKKGVNVELNWVWTACAETGPFAGRVINYNHGCVLNDATAKLGIALSAEFTICNITRAELVRGN